MLTSSRRDIVFSAAMAGAALGLDSCFAIAATAARKAQTPESEPGFHKYRVGNAEVIALYDGIWEKRHDAKFLTNATTAEVKQALAAAGLTTAFVPIPVTVFAVRLNGKLTLCDAGGGDQMQEFNPESAFMTGGLVANMKAAGINPKDVETILISHFHADHVFGLLEKKTGAAAFPNAEIIVPAAEFKWWTDASLVGRLPFAQRPLARRIQSVIPNWKNVLQVDSENEVVPGIRFIKCPGHTPGHTAFHLSSGNEQLMISSDAAYVPALCMRHPGWRSVFDQDGAMAVTSRRKLLDRVVADQMLICGSHFPWPGLNRIAKDGDGYALTPHDIPT